MIFNKKVFFDGKPTRIITELMTALDEVINLVEVQSTLNFENIQLEEDKELPVNVIKDLIDIDGPKDDVKDDGLSNKLLGESFYLISSLSVYDYLDYIDFFISIRSEGVGKGAMAVIAIMLVTAGMLLAVTAETAATPGKEVMAVIATMLVTAGSLLAATAETAAMPGKGAMAVIAVMPVTAGTPLVATAETVVTLGTRLD